VDLNNTFFALRQTYLARAESKQLALRFRSGGRWVMADPHLLERLMGNLIENAIKYTETGGVLVCARHQLSPTGAQQVRLEVRDSGLGIPTAHHVKVFDEFFQLGNPGRDRAQGLGIGLSIVKRLVHLQGLSLALHSTPGCGTTFALHLTASSAAQSPTQRPPAPDAARHQTTTEADANNAIALQGLSLLVVDDEVAITTAMSTLLSSFGAKVVTASGTDTAMQAVQDHPDLDIAIIDYRLGSQESGTELAPRLIAARGRSLPFVIITGDTGPAEIQHLRNSGATICFKPLEAQTLLAVISELCANSAQQTPHLMPAQGSPAPPALA
jgi:CheY-like chemotaxis protein